MKTNLTFLFSLLSASLLVAADSDPRKALLDASSSLAAKPNYAWKTTVEEPDQPTGTIDGKTEMGGATLLRLARADRAFEAVLKGAKGAVKTDDGWKTLAEARESEGSESGAVRFVARLVQNYKAPSAELADLAGKVKDLKFVDGVYSGALTEPAAKELLLYRTGGGANGPDVSGAKGSIKFWLKDGGLSKYEYHLQGTVSFNGNERDADRTHTTEIKDVGTTKVTVPEEAAKKLQTSS